MIHLALQTEFSFKKCFMHIKDIHKYATEGAVGVADLSNTFAHVHLSKEAKKHGFKPIYGVRLHVLPEENKQRTCQTSWVFIARNDAGLKEIYELVTLAYEQFYYFPRITMAQSLAVSSDIFIIPSYLSPSYLNELIGTNRLDLEGISPSSPRSIGVGRVIPLQENNYPEVGDKGIYQLLAGSRKTSDGYSFNFDGKEHPQHIMSEEEIASYIGHSNWIDPKDIADQCDAKIDRAEMVKYDGSLTVIGECLKGSRNLEINLENPKYSERLDREIKLIKEKGYEDYFLITSDMINFAKKSMLVGPARGSSAGSLVCFLMGITTVDPIIHDLVFERFIDVNRFDLPDIDVDFPDKKREKVVKYLVKKYGKERVSGIANISRLMPKSAIVEWSKGLGIPPYETDAVKAAIIERSSGDARAAMCISDTFETTEPGKDFVEKYPAMKTVSNIEGHAHHTSKHAAGVIVSTKPLTEYCGVNVREGTVMLDKKDAESLNLLKIDILGLRTLSIIEDACDLIGMDSHSFYSLPLDDKPTFKLMDSGRLTGIFQFEGQALMMVVKQMGVSSFNDIAAITALARPGALNSGGTSRYIKYSTGVDTPEYYSDTHRSITGDTHGIVVYQEQMMNIARDIGGLSWSEVSELRRAASKSMGDEFFGKYKNKFVKGALKEGYAEEVCERLWTDISASGSWSFNKSHAVSYGLVSYWTAWLKCHYPMEFAVASLNNARDDDHAIKLLRDMVKFEKIEYLPVDPDKSGLLWTTHSGKLVGGLLNMKGIGTKKANAILTARRGGKALTPSLFKALANPVTPYDIIFPADHYFGMLYKDPVSYGLNEKPSCIIEVEGKGDFVFLGCLIDRNLRDLNEQVFLEKRKGERVEEHNLYLNFRLEDDTDQVLCTVQRFDYQDMGKDIAENGNIGEDWFLVKGRIRSDFRKVDVHQVVKLDKAMRAMA